jgi:hypothetical protein
LGATKQYRVFRCLCTHFCVFFVFACQAENTAQTFFLRDDFYLII